MGICAHLIHQDISPSLGFAGTEVMPSINNCDSNTFENNIRKKKKDNELRKKIWEIQQWKLLVFHGIVESVRLEKPSKISKSKCQPSATEPRPQVPGADISGAVPGMVTPWTACSSAFPGIFLWISMPLILSSVNNPSFSTAQILS